MKNSGPNKNLDEIECHRCDSKLPTVQNLRMHIRVNHMSHCQTQTASVDAEEKITQTCELELLKEIDQYRCFYCEQEISGEQYLLDHRITCHGATEIPSLFSLPVRPTPLLYKCAICGLVKSSEEEILNHKKSVHAKQ